MSKFFDAKSLKFKMWSYFTLFSVLMFVMLWLFQIIFLNTYYETMKMHEIRKITKEVAAHNRLEDFEDFIYQTGFNNGAYIQLFDCSGTPLLTDGNPAARRLSHPEENSIFKLISAIDEEKSGEIVSFINAEKYPNMRLAVSGMKLSDKNGEELYLTILAPLAPITATTAVLKNQLLLVTAILILISFGLSYFIAKRIAKPLIKITDGAHSLAQGDYEVVFKKGGYTEINQLADTLNFATNELSKTDALRRDLIANVSHDLRTPLTIIKSYSEMIRDFSGENSEKRNAHAQVIIDEADKMSALVSDILDLSRAESGTMTLSFSNFDLKDTVNEIINRFTSLNEYKSYNFSVSFDEDCMVYADEQKISQTVYNLISNAVNYTGEDKKIDVCLKKEEKEVLFSVTDTGCGIAENELTRVWERYYRSSRAQERYSAGTGIGLSIVKNLLTAHNAKYGVNSTPNSGSTFWFKLPLA